MKYFIAIAAILAIAIGVAGIVLGEADDSPGLQLLGVVFVVGAIAFSVRSVRRSSSDTTRAAGSDTTAQRRSAAPPTRPDLRGPPRKPGHASPDRAEEGT